MASVQGRRINFEAVCIFLSSIFSQTFYGFLESVAKCIETVSLKLNYEMSNIFKSASTTSFRIPVNLY